jgi:5'-3' exonuclease
MIVSSDSDLNQLVKFHGFDDPFVVQYDPDANKKCYYIDDHIKESLEDKKNDIFSDVYSHPLMDMMTNQHKIIDKFKKVIIKIVSGDSGDNIPSCYKSIKGKNLSFGEKRAEQLYVEYPTIKLLEEANLRLVASKIISITKSGEIGRIDEIVNNIIRNKKLIILDEHNIDNYSVLEQACYGFIKSSFPINLKDIYI